MMKAVNTSVKSMIALWSSTRLEQMQIEVINYIIIAKKEYCIIPGFTTPVRVKSGSLVSSLVSIKHAITLFCSSP
jgi:hypothetical protein